MPSFDEIHNDPAWWFTRVTHSEDLANLGERQSDGLSREDELEPVDCVVAVDPITAVAARRARNEAKLFVVANS
jgi:hypothetical protein